MSGENASTIDTLMELRSTSDFLDEDQTEVTNAALHAFRYFSAVVTAILLAVGLCGNVLTICAMTSREYWSKPYSRFVVALAVSDACVMAMVPFNKNDCSSAATVRRQIVQRPLMPFLLLGVSHGEDDVFMDNCCHNKRKVYYVQHYFVQRIRILAVKLLLFFAYIFTSEAAWPSNTYRRLKEQNGRNVASVSSSRLQQTYVSLCALGSLLSGCQLRPRSG